jgi:hypothetical protein
MADPKAYSTIFGKIVLSKFDSMPEWARLSAFFVALFVLVYVTLHSVNAKYFVTGTVLAPSPTHPGSHQFVRGYDVRWSDNYAGTNSKGHFVFVLSPLEYLSLYKSGNHLLEIWKPGDKNDVQDQQICQKVVSFDRLQGSFEDFYIDGKCSTIAAATHDLIRPESPRGYGMLRSAYAASSVGRGADYRILVRTVRFGAKWPRTDSAQIILFQGGEDLPLLNLSGSSYGSVLILPGESFAFTDGVYLPSRSLAGGRVRLSDKGGLGGFFRYIEEWFELPNKMELGKQLDLVGSLGTDLSVIPVGPSIITVYRKDGEADYYPRLAQDLLGAGVTPTISASPAGADKTTNTLFVGATVPPATVRSVVAAIAKNGVQLKRIAYPYKFTYTSDTSIMQLGWSLQCERAAPISQTELTRLAGTSDAGLQTFLERYKECRPSPPANRVP